MSRPLLKVCGLTRPEDVALCHEAGADFTGFILAPESPRFVTPAQVAAMPRGPARRVGVVTDAPLDDVMVMALGGSLDLIQLHGGQNTAFCRQLGPDNVIKVLWPERGTPDELQRQIDEFAPVCAYFLFDAGNAGGGSGKPFAWEVLRDLAIPRPWLLAGGIGPGNALEALAACTPTGLDVNSGVESAPGIKDANAVRTIATQLATATR